MNTLHLLRLAGGLAALLTCAGCGGSAPPPSQHVAAQPDSGLVQGPIGFVDGYRRGCELAQQDGKPMLVFFTAPWCDYCRAMMAEAFHHQAVVKLSGQFVCVLVDADAEPEVCRQFRVRGYPTVQFLSPRGTPLNRMTGKQGSAELVLQMQAALQALARRTDEPRTF